MRDLGLGQIAVCKTRHTLPRPRSLTFLTATTQLMQPKLRDTDNKFIQSTHVIWDGMVTEPAPYHTCQPASRFAYLVVPTAPQLLLGI